MYALLAFLLDRRCNGLSRRSGCSLSRSGGADDAPEGAGHAVRWGEPLVRRLGGFLGPGAEGGVLEGAGDGGGEGHAAPTPKDASSGSQTPHLPLTGSSMKQRGQTSRGLIRLWRGARAHSLWTAAPASSDQSRWSSISMSSPQAAQRPGYLARKVTTHRQAADKSEQADQRCRPPCHRRPPSHAASSGRAPPPCERRHRSVEER